MCKSWQVLKGSGSVMNAQGEACPTAPTQGCGRAETFAVLFSDYESVWRRKDVPFPIWLQNAPPARGDNVSNSACPSHTGSISPEVAILFLATCGLSFLIRFRGSCFQWDVRKLTPLEIKMFWPYFRCDLGRASWGLVEFLVTSWKPSFVCGFHGFSCNIVAGQQGEVRKSRQKAPQLVWNDWQAECSRSYRKYTVLWEGLLCLT